MTFWPSTWLLLGADQLQQVTQPYCGPASGAETQGNLGVGISQSTAPGTLTRQTQSGLPGPAQIVVPKFDRWADLAVASSIATWNYVPGWGEQVPTAHGVRADPDRARS